MINYLKPLEEIEIGNGVAISNADSKKIWDKVSRNGELKETVIFQEKFYNKRLEEIWGTGISHTEEHKTIATVRNRKRIYSGPGPEKKKNAFNPHPTETKTRGQAYLKTINHNQRPT